MRGRIGGIQPGCWTGMWQEYALCNCDGEGVPIAKRWLTAVTAAGRVGVVDIAGSEGRRPGPDHASHLRLSEMPSARAKTAAEETRCDQYLACQLSLLSRATECADSLSPNSLLGRLVSRLERETECAD